MNISTTAVNMFKSRKVSAISEASEKETESVDKSIKVQDKP